MCLQQSKKEIYFKNTIKFVLMRLEAMFDSTQIVGLMHETVSIVVISTIVSYLATEI